MAKKLRIFPLTAYSLLLASRSLLPVCCLLSTAYCYLLTPYFLLLASRSLLPAVCF